MAELKANEVNEVKATEMNELKVAATEQTAKSRKPINLLRKRFKMRDGRELFSYYVKGHKYGRDIEAEFAARDQGGYGFLDMLFEISKNVELVMHDEVMEDNGRKLYYTVYEAQGVDADGEIVSIKIRPKQDSDKAYLALILKDGGEATA